MDLVSISINNFCINGYFLTILSVYRSPKCTIIEFLGIVEGFMNSYTHNSLVVVDDTNIDILNSPHFSDLTGLFLSYDCHNCHGLITRPSTETFIDQVFSNIIGKISVDSVECTLTDHNL